MRKYLPIALGVAAIIATQIACTYFVVRSWRAELGVNCLDESHPALQHLHIDRPEEFCFAVAPRRLDQDSLR